MKKVLIVDDEEDMVWSLKRNLRNETLYIDIFTARSGEEALEILKKMSIDLVVTDIKMQGMSGLDLLLNIRQIRPQTGVIVMTAYPTPAFRKEALFRGCLHFIEKPFDIKQLRELVRHAITEDKGFKGTVTGIELTDIIQINCISKTTAALRVRTMNKEGVLYFKDGRIVNAIYENLEGEDAFYEILGFEGGTLESVKGAETPTVTIGKGYESLLMEGLRRLDEANRDRAETGDAAGMPAAGKTTDGKEKEDSLSDIGEIEEKNNGENSLKEENMFDVKQILKEFTTIDGVTAACIVGRDGFVIDSMAPAGVDTDMMAAIASTGLGSSEAMGKQLSKGNLNVSMIEYEGGSIFLSPVGQDAFLAIIAEEKANLGMIRFSTRKYRDKLSLATVI